MSDRSTATDEVTFTMEIRDGRTEIRVSGDRDTCVIVTSASGETIYLPPEDFDRPAGSQSTYDSPYDARSGSQATPYASGPNPESVTGLEPTDDGYLVVHPEPVTDLRFLR